MFFGKIFRGLEEQKGQEFEEEIDCQAICNFHYQEQEIGGYLLKKNGGYEVKFGFSLEGLHCYQSESQIENILKSWNEGLISLPREGIRFHQISTVESEVIAELKARAEGMRNPTLKFLAYSKKKATEQRIKQSRRCEYHNLIFTAHQYIANRTEDDNFLEEKLLWLLDKYKYLNQEKERETRSFYGKFFRQSFAQGYLAWKQNFQQRFHLNQIKSLSAWELWDYAWKQFNETETPAIPHLIDIYLDSEPLEMKESFGSQKALSSAILAGGHGSPSIPYRLQKWNHWIAIKNKFVGAIVWEEAMEGYKNEQQQFDFFWQRLKEIPNAEIVVEVHPINQKIEEFLMKRAVRGNTWDIKETQKTGDVNVRALENNKDILSAQEKMLGQAKVCMLSTVVFLYRDSLEELNQDIQQAQKLFPPNCFFREVDKVDRLWLNKLPLVKEELLRKERRIKLLSDEIPLPLVCPQKFDERGFELTTREGHKPIKIDFLHQHRGMLTIARTGRGKTTLATDTVDYNLGESIKGVCIDYGNVDGTTTYTDYNNGLGRAGVNLQAGVDDYNIAQMPDLRKLEDPKLREKHSITSQGFILSFLKSIILGEDRTSRTAKRVSALLGYAIPQFYNAASTRGKIAAGHRGGLGSSDWLKMPTIIDLRDFIANISERDFGESNIFAEAKEEILWGLNTFIHSRLGQKLSVPSKINVEADFLCIAMREARDDDEMALLSLCAQSLAINQALKYPKCNVLLDEGNIIGKNKSVLTGIAEFVVNGRKGGIFCHVIMQNVDTLMAAGDLGQAIIDNLPLKMIGSIEESAIPNLAKALKLPESLFYENASNRFIPDQINLGSYWLMLAEGLKIKVAHNPSPELMALVASNPEEAAARKLYLEAYSNFLQGISIFTPDYVKARKGVKQFHQLKPPTRRTRKLCA